MPTSATFFVYTVASGVERIVGAVDRAEWRIFAPPPKKAIADSKKRSSRYLRASDNKARKLCADGQTNFFRLLLALPPVRRLEWPPTRLYATGHCSLPTEFLRICLWVVHLRWRALPLDPRSHRFAFQRPSKSQPQHSSSRTLFVTSYCSLPEASLEN